MAESGEPFGINVAALRVTAIEEITDDLEPSVLEVVMEPTVPEVVMNIVDDDLTMEAVEEVRAKTVVKDL